MNKLSLCALVIIGTLGLSANAFAHERHEGHGQYHPQRVADHRRDFRDHDHDGMRAEHREHERREWATRRDHDRDRWRHQQEERREWARKHHHDGNRYGWQQGRNNPHQDATRQQRRPASAPNARPSRTVANNYRSGRDYRNR